MLNQDGGFHPTVFPVFRTQITNNLIKVVSNCSNTTKRGIPKIREGYIALLAVINYEVAEVKAVCCPIGLHEPV